MIDILYISLYIIIGISIAFWVIPRIFYICVKMGILAIYQTKKNIKEKENQNEQEDRTNRKT